MLDDSLVSISIGPLDVLFVSTEDSDLSSLEEEGGGFDSSVRPVIAFGVSSTVGGELVGDETSW